MSKTKKLKRLAIHPLCAAFPDMDADEFAALKADMQSNGQREPITLHDGKIIDGRNRYRACLDLELKPKTRKWDGKGSLVAFVIGMNINRRHLDASQRAMIAAELANMKAGENQTTKAVAQNCATSIPDAAATMNVSERSVQQAVAVKQGGAPELRDAVKAGEVSVSIAAQAAKTLSTPEQIRALRNAEKKGITPAAALKDAMDSADEKDEAKEPDQPWDKFNAGIDAVLSSLRGACGKLREAIDYDPETKRAKSKWARNYTGAVGELNQFIRRLGHAMPAEADSKRPGGYATVAELEAKKSMAKKD